MKEQKDAFPQKKTQYDCVVVMKSVFGVALLEGRRRLPLTKPFMNGLTRSHIPKLILFNSPTTNTDTSVFNI